MWTSWARVSQCLGRAKRRLGPTFRAKPHTQGRRFSKALTLLLGATGATSQGLVQRTRTRSQLLCSHSGDPGFRCSLCRVRVSKGIHPLLTSLAWEQVPQGLVWVALTSQSPAQGHTLHVSCPPALPCLRFPLPLTPRDPATLAQPHRLCPLLPTGVGPTRGASRLSGLCVSCRPTRSVGAGVGRVRGRRQQARPLWTSLVGRVPTGETPGGSWDQGLLVGFPSGIKCSGAQGQRRSPSIVRAPNATEFTPKGLVLCYVNFTSVTKYSLGRHLPHQTRSHETRTQVLLGATGPSQLCGCAPTVPD